MPKKTKTEVRRERAYRLLMYPLSEALSIGAITKEEFDKHHREVMESLDER
jgi:hypothetical protein